MALRSHLAALLALMAITVFAASKFNPLNVSYLEPGSQINHSPRRSLGFREDDLQIFCYKGKPKYLVNIFNTITLQLDIENEDFIQYEGGDPDAVRLEYENQRSIFSFSFLSSKRRTIKMNPFNQTCIGVVAGTNYQVSLNLIRIDFWRVLMLVGGLLMFFWAQRLSENAVFYYLSGVLLGITCSILIVVYLISRLFPRKPFAVGAMLGGWTLALYFGQMLFENLKVILVTHQLYVFWYVAISATISFCICYRAGPPKNPRSKNLIRWGLQLAAILLIFYSTAFQEAAVGVIILIALLYHFPRRYIANTRAFWRRRFPPKPRLLTNEEYYEQGVRETTRALDELRQYCSSPECNQWRTILKLKDPARFASFMEGSSHIVDDEILDYETSNMQFADSDEEEEEENEGLEPIAPLRARQAPPPGWNVGGEASEGEDEEEEVVPRPSSRSSRPSPGFQEFVRRTPTRLMNGSLHSTPATRRRVGGDKR